MTPMNEGRRVARGAANDDRVRLLARVGYAAKGAFYLVMGILALQLAAGNGGETTGTQGAIEHIGQAPFGKVLLALIALGLVGLVIWRFAQALLDTDRGGSDAKGAVKRVGRIVSGVIYAGLLVFTVRVLMGSGGGGGDGNAPAMTARLMELPAGRWLVALAGLAVLGFGLHEASRGVKGKLGPLALDGIAARHAHWVKRISRFGLISRGSVFALMGGFLVLSAIRFDPSEAKGLGETLGSLADRPLGWVLLGIAALGFAAYGVYAWVEARYRRFAL